MNKDFFSYKKIFICSLFSTVPFSLLSGLLSLFNLVPVNFNDNPTYGWKGFLVAVLFTPFIAFIFSCLNWLFLNFGVILMRIFLKEKK